MKLSLLKEPIIDEANKPHQETEIESNTSTTEDTSIQDYQLVRDRKRKQVKLNPRYDHKT